MQPPKFRNAVKGYEFQNIAAEILGDYFHILFRCENPIPIGDPPKQHKFDLVSKDMKYIGECKDYKWTSGENVPSAKISSVNEAVFYLQQLPTPESPTDQIRFVVMRRAVNAKHKDSLAEYYYRMNKHLLKGVIILEIDVSTKAVKMLGV